jgi:LysR family transcriptional regulator, cell division regulator
MASIVFDDGWMDARLLPDVMVFLEVVRAGSITRAAERLHTVQSNVTARIKKLEGALGVTLLKRHARGIKATPAGEAALAMALRMDSVLEDFRFAFGQGARAKVAKLRIGAIETVLAAHLPGVVAGFLRQHPHVDISIHTGSSATILKQIKDGELDLGFVSRAPKILGFREQQAFTDELVVVAPPTVRSLNDLLDAEGLGLKILVQRLGCSYTERMLGVLAEKAPRHYRLLELGTLEGILGFVELGLGFAAMPRGFIRSLSIKRKVALIELPPQVRKLQTYLVAPAINDARVAINEFIPFCTTAKMKTSLS